MAKKHFGKLITLVAIAGAATAGISYFLRYKSFHKELDEDFHDFEEDFDDHGCTEDTGNTKERNYVSLNPDRSSEYAQEETPKEPESIKVSEVSKEDAPEAVSTPKPAATPEAVSTPEPRSASEPAAAPTPTPVPATTIVEDLTE
ncbi:MAG: hypothetical protein RR242_01240 [Clostridium sp.]